MADIKTFAEQLVSLSVKDVNQLAEILKTEYGIVPATAATPVMVSAEAGSQGEATEEQSSFDLILKSSGASKLAIVKLMKEVTGLGLKEAKELVDAAPKPIKTGLAKDEADSLKNKFEQAGAEIELK